MVSVVLADLAAGLSREETPNSYQRLRCEDIDAALACAAALARERFVGIPVEATP